MVLPPPPRNSATFPRMIRPTFLVISAAAVCACSQPPEKQIVADAVSALGGQSRILAVKTLVIEGEGTNGNLGQDMTMDAASQQFVVSGYKRAVDVVNLRARTEQTRTPNFAYFQGPQAQKQVLGVDGDVGYNIAPNGTATRVSNAVAKDRQAEIYHHPIKIVRAALDPEAKLANPRTAGNERVVDVTTSNGLRFTLATDAATNLPTRVVSMTDNTNLGDVAIETGFADYEDVAGLKLPKRLTTKTDKYKTAEIRVTRQAIDGETGDLTAPPAAASAPAVAAPPPATVTAEELAKGIWFLGGQSHHSVLVEFADHLTLIEAPQNDTRALAVIAKAKSLRPEKPLTQVINTHHHFDHSGGIRAAVAEGLTVITHKANAAFYQDAVARPHTIVPDALAKAPKPLTVTPVDEELELKDGTMTVNVYHVAGNPHADTMLMAYFPKEKILVEADAFSPGSAVQPYAANLKENISRRGLKVDRVVPLHGTIVPYSELLKIQ
jgi:glyoxylase-like metal-dependent hydrolase (beta-lactamase superfamily II)